MTNTPINIEQATVLLEQQVAAKGDDYVTPGTCRYFDPAPTDTYEERELTDTPSCIVGHILHGLGVSGLEFDPELNGTTLDGLLKLPTDQSNYLLERFDLDFTDEAAELLRVAQSEQDQRSSWGAAVRTAKQRMAQWPR